MKLQLSQALATVLDIHIVPFRVGQPEQIYVTRIGGDGGIEQQVGVVGESTLDQAIWKALELHNLSAPSNFAVFPIKSGREDYYMSIERMLLHQEQTPEFEGKAMWQMMSAGDPRELIEMVMLQIRECAQAIVHPVRFQEALLRTACLIVSCMQWTSDWIARLRLREAGLRKQEPEVPKVVEFEQPEQQPVEPVPPLFGVAGLQVVEPPEAYPEKEGDVEPPPPPEDEGKPVPPPPSKGPGNGKRKRSRKRH